MAGCWGQRPSRRALVSTAPEGCARGRGALSTRACRTAGQPLCRQQCYCPCHAQLVCWPRLPRLEARLAGAAAALRQLSSPVGGFDHARPASTACWPGAGQGLRQSHFDSADSSSKANLAGCAAPAAAARPAAKGAASTTPGRRAQARGAHGRLLCAPLSLAVPFCHQQKVLDVGRCSPG